MSDATKLIAAHVMDRRMLLDDLLKTIERIVDCPIKFGDLLDLGDLSWPLIRDRQTIEEFAKRNVLDAEFCSCRQELSAFVSLMCLSRVL